jgi:hypothetical protein
MTGQANPELAGDPLEKRGRGLEVMARASVGRLPIIVVIIAQH